MGGEDHALLSLQLAPPRRTSRTPTGTMILAAAVTSGRLVARDRRANRVFLIGDGVLAGTRRDRSRQVASTGPVRSARYLDEPLPSSDVGNGPPAVAARRIHGEAGEQGPRNIRALCARMRAGPWHLPFLARYVRFFLGRESASDCAIRPLLFGGLNSFHHSANHSVATCPEKPESLAAYGPDT